MNALEKYNIVRDSIKNGDIILFRGNALLSRAIRYLDNAYFNHIGVVMECNGRLLIVDSNADGVHPEFLSLRMERYTDFEVLRVNKPQEIIVESLYNIFKVAEKGIKYNFILIPQIAITRKFNIIFDYDKAEDRNICSEWARNYTVECDVKCYDFDNWITPEDFIRFRNPKEISIIIKRG